MVNITKWVLLGGSLILLGLFTKEAAQTSLTGTLARTGQAGAGIGSALSSVGGGIGNVFKGLLTPLWEVGNFAKSFGFGSDLWGNSKVDPQASGERIYLTGQGGGFDDAEQQGGGDTGINQDPIPNHPNWFNIPSAYGQEASGIFDVGGSNIKISNIDWGNGTVVSGIPLSDEARDWYRDIGVTADPINTHSNGGGGGGSNVTTGGGGGFGSTPSTSLGSGSFGSKPASGGWGL